MAAFFVITLFSLHTGIAIDAHSQVSEPHKSSVSDCAAQWNAMLFAQARKHKFNDQPVSAKDGFILADLHNGTTLSVHFECQNGQLVHTHCRYGDDTNHNLIFIPAGRWLLNAPDQDFTTQRSFAYAACVKSTPDDIRAFFYVTSKLPFEMEKFPVPNLRACPRLTRNGKWCGTRIKIDNCLSEWLPVQDGRVVTEDGSLLFMDIYESSYFHQMKLKFGCSPEGKLELRQCDPASPGKRPLSPGEFIQLKGFYYACPHKDALAGKTWPEIRKQFLVSEDKGQMKGFSQVLPKGFDYARAGFKDACIAQWEKMTDKGRREFTTDGFIRIADAPADLKAPEAIKGVPPTVFVKFECNGYGLYLDHCVVVPLISQEFFKAAQRVDNGKCISLDKEGVIVA